MSVPALRFNEFSGDWEEKTLGDVAEIKRGAPSQHLNYVTESEDGIRLLRINDFLKNEPVYVVDTDNIKKFRVQTNDLLIAGTGATAGIVFRVPNEFSNMSFSYNAPRIRVTKAYYGFIYFYLISDVILRQQRGLFVGNAQPFLDTDAMRSFVINAPSLSEQTKIANFLTAVDEKISILTRKADLLSQYKKEVMQQIFSQELRFKDDDGQEFPEWEEKTLGDVCICLDNQRKPLNDAERQTMQGEFPYWGANNIMDYVDDYLFDETIVLLAEDGGNFNEYKTRPIANISHGKCWVNNHTHVLKGEIGLSNEFLFYSLVHKNITGYVSGGTRAKLTKGEMLKIEISIPNPAEQTKIANFLTAIDEKITSNQTQLNAVKQYKQGLLQQMFV